jgi:hypothetical protein
VFGTITNAVNAQVVVGGDAHAAFHDAFTNNGALFVTAGSELLTLENLGFGGGSSLNVELAETDPDGGFGQVNVAGAATLAGTLNVDLAGGFMPQLGDSFQIISAGVGRTGFFASEILPSLPSGLGWDVQYNPNSVVLSIVSAGLVGDFNDDGIVNAGDYVVWRKNLNTTNTLPNDPHGGTIGAAQFNTWRENFGNVAGSGSSASEAIPEPSAAVLLVVGILSACLMRHRAASKANALCEIATGGQ